MKGGPTTPGLRMSGSHSMISVSWDAADGSARFHVWLEVQDGQPVKPYRVKHESRIGSATKRRTIYVNPPIGTATKIGGNTTYRDADADAKANRDTVALALNEAEAHGLFELGQQAHREEEAAKELAERTAYAARVRAALQAHADQVLADNASDHADLLQALVSGADDDELHALGIAVNRA
jgi:hypothetical protein